MSIPQKPKPGKLVVGLFLREREIIQSAAGRLVACFGEPDAVSPWLSFHHTDYYKAEMGGPLSRRLFAFRDLIAQERLPDIKLLTNRIEGDFMVNGNRRVNMDPGYLLAERFVLATGKNYAHRIYLRDGIYADLTLTFHGGKYCPLHWTYPDYTEKDILVFLSRVREKYLWQLRQRDGDK